MERYYHQLPQGKRYKYREPIKAKDHFASGHCGVASLVHACRHIYKKVVNRKEVRVAYVELLRRQSLNERENDVLDRLSGRKRIDDVYDAGGDGTGIGWLREEAWMAAYPDEKRRFFMVPEQEKEEFYESLSLTEEESMGRGVPCLYTHPPGLIMAFEVILCPPSSQYARRPNAPLEVGFILHCNLREHLDDHCFPDVGPNQFRCPEDGRDYAGPRAYLVNSSNHVVPLLIQSSLNPPVSKLRLGRHTVAHFFLLTLRAIPSLQPEKRGRGGPRKEKDQSAPPTPPKRKPGRPSKNKGYPPPLLPGATQGQGSSLPPAAPRQLPRRERTDSRDQSPLTGATEEGIGSGVCPPGVDAWAKDIVKKSITAGGLSMAGGKKNARISSRDWPHMYKDIPDPTLHYSKTLLSLGDYYMSFVRVTFWAAELFFPQ